VKIYLAWGLYLPHPRLLINHQPKTKGKISAQGWWVKSGNYSLQCELAIDEPDGNHNLKININAQQKIRKRAITKI
jgi:hypothetical protein